MANDFEERVREAIAAPRNMGEMADADAVGTVGNAECGDMLRMWLKFSDKDGRKVIDRASFQSFGCQTAVAVASLATEILAGKTLEEAQGLRAEELSEPLGPLPPMKMHCGQMVEGALKEALTAGADSTGSAEQIDESRPAESSGYHLAHSLASSGGNKVKVVKLEESSNDEPESGGGAAAS